MKDLYNIVEGLFDIDPNDFNDKYIAGKSSAEIDWMMKNSHPKSKNNLESIMYRYCNKYGWKSDLNWIDVSAITDMGTLFYGYDKFNGDISKWDVSHVKDMYGMFSNSVFNGDISKWDVSNVKDMRFMFANSEFNNDIKDWDVSRVENMTCMFTDSSFNGDISKWNPKKCEKMYDVFRNSPMEENPPKWYLLK